MTGKSVQTNQSSSTYADDGNGTTNLADFIVAGEPFTWIDTPSPDWLAALDKSYGLFASNEDWVDVVDCDGCVPEPATLALLAVGVLMLARSRAQT